MSDHASFSCHEGILSAKGLLICAAIIIACFVFFAHCPQLAAMNPMNQISSIQPSDQVKSQIHTMLTTQTIAMPSGN